MGNPKTLSVLACLGLLAAGNAWADRGRVHFGVYVGPYWGPAWYYPPPARYYYPPYYAPVIIERQAPPVYVEQPVPAPGPASAATAAPANWWYYCEGAGGYYPYVRECPGGWQRVSPQPPGQP